MFTHVAGLWYNDDNTPTAIRSHFHLVASESLGTNVGRILLIALLISALRLARKATFIHFIITYTLYTSIGALAMLQRLPPSSGQISDSIQPQAQLSILLLLLPRILYLPAALFACFTSPGLFQLVGITHITYKFFKCTRRTKATEPT